MPKVSICVPVYNVEKYIERCIKSIQSQSLLDIEIIVVNDCSPDSSMNIVNEYATNDNRIRIIEHEENKGLMRARQTGYKAAKGDYITFCDSDDTLTVDAIENLLNKAIETGADVVSGELNYIPTIGEPILFRGGQKLSYGSTPTAVYKALLKHEFGHNLCSKLFRRKLLQQYEYETFDYFTNGEDGYLFYQVVENTSMIIHIEQPVYNYYQNMDSSSQKRLTEEGLRSILLLLLLCKKLMMNYNDIAPLFSRFISKSLITKYQSGYNKDFPLDNWIKEHDLSDFVSPKYILSNYGFLEFSKLYIKKNLYPIVSNLIKK